MQCELKAANGRPGIECDLSACVFWREVTGAQDGCAIQYFDMLDGDREMSAWLLALKKRLESEFEERR